MSSKSMGELVGVLFLSRDVAHRAHLASDSYAEHMALGSFYEDIITLADSLVETFQGRGEKVKDIPYYSDSNKGTPVVGLKKLLGKVETLRTDCCAEDSTIQNIIDEIIALYLSTIYKLTFLK